MTLLTRVRMIGVETSRELPLGFFGVGADLRLGRVRLGPVLRVHAHGPLRPRGRHTHSLTPEAELATQGQFYAKIAL